MAEAVTDKPVEPLSAEALYTIRELGIDALYFETFERLLAIAADHARLVEDIHIESQACNVMATLKLRAEAERDALRARIELLEKVRKLFVSQRNALDCDRVTHTRQTYHDVETPCPVMAEIDATLAACDTKETP